MPLPIIGILLSLIAIAVDFKVVWVFGFLVQLYFLFSLYKYSQITGIKIS